MTTELRRVQLRRGTAADWAAIDPVLAQGEPGFEHDTGVLKVGDGSTAWSALPAVASPTSVSTGSSSNMWPEDPIEPDMLLIPGPTGPAGPPGSGGSGGGVVLWPEDPPESETVYQLHQTVTAASATGGLSRGKALDLFGLPNLL